MSLLFRSFSDELVKIANRRAIKFILDKLPKGAAQEWKAASRNIKDPARRSPIKFSEFMTTYSKKHAKKISPVTGKRMSDFHPSSSRIRQAKNSKAMGYANGRARSKHRSDVSYQLSRLVPTSEQVATRVRMSGAGLRGPGSHRRKTMLPTEARRSLNDKAKHYSSQRNSRDLLSGAHPTKKGDFFIPRKNYMGGRPKHRDEFLGNSDLKSLNSWKKSGLVFKGGGPVGQLNNRKDIFVSRNPAVAAGYALNPVSQSTGKGYVHAFRGRKLKRRGETHHLATIDRGLYKDPLDRKVIEQARRDGKAATHRGASKLGANPYYEDVVKFPKDASKASVGSWKVSPSRQGDQLGHSLRPVGKSPKFDTFQKYLQK